MRDDKVWRNVKKGWSLKRCAVDINYIIPIIHKIRKRLFVVYLEYAGTRLNRSKFPITDKDRIPGNRTSKNKDRKKSRSKSRICKKSKIKEEKD